MTLEGAQALLPRGHLGRQVDRDPGGVRRLQRVVRAVEVGGRGPAGELAGAHRERDALAGPGLQQAGGVAGEQHPARAEG